MTITQDRIRLVRLYEEPNGSFGVDASASMGSFIDVPFSSFRIETLGVEQLEPNALVQHIDDKVKAVPGVKTWTATSEIPISTFDTRAGNGVAAVQGGIGRLLKIIMGGERLGTGDLVSDATPAVGAFDVATVGRFAEGSACGIVGPTSGILEAREIESIVSSTLNFKHDFSEAPADTDAILNAATYYLTAGNGDVTTTAQFAMFGAEPQDRWLLMGGYPTSVALELGPGILPKLTVNWEGPYWLPGDSVATPFNGALSFAAYSNDTYRVTMDSYFRVSGLAVQSLTGTLIDAPTIDLQTQISYIAERTPSGVQTRIQPVRNHQPPVATVVWREPYEDYTRQQARDTKADYSIHYQIGSDPTDGCLLLTVPTAELMNHDVVEQNGLRYQETTVAARCDDDTSESTPSHLGLSAMRIHLL